MANRRPTWILVSEEKDEDRVDAFDGSRYKNVTLFRKYKLMWTDPEEEYDDDEGPEPENSGECIITPAREEPEVKKEEKGKEPLILDSFGLPRPPRVTDGAGTSRPRECGWIFSDEEEEEVEEEETDEDSS